MEKKSDSSQTYRESLPVDVRNRYDQKISVIGLDPYELLTSEFDRERTHWPELNLVDVIHYLVFQQSAYTKDQLRNYKALEAFRLFQDGWIRETMYKEVNGHHLLRAKVTHSMAVRNKLLDAWIIIGEEGSILSAHCTCMAGLGECCSHVAAVLFALETWTRMKTEVSCTDTPAYWMFPTATRFEAPYKRLREMDCTSASKKRKTNQAPVTSPETCVPNIPSPTKREEKSFLGGLHQVMPEAALLSLEKEFCARFIPKSLLADWPIDMASVFVKDYAVSNLEDLLKVCKDIDIAITPEQASFVEAQTQAQSNSPFWLKYRSGRVTASKFYAVTHTTIEKPSVSLLKSVCGVSSNQLQTAAIEWGKKKEPVAKKAYANGMKGKHQNFKIRESGLVLNEQYPEFGASPDGIVSCDCCGKGCLEVKCPYTAREMYRLDLTWLETVHDTKQLARNHPNYYQVQMQMHLTETDYCDFYVWSPNVCHQERIYKDGELWSKYAIIAKAFHAKCVMPELVCNFFSRQTLKPLAISGPNPVAGSGETDCYCICGGTDDGRRMIACEGENCIKQWYHMACINMKRAPKGKWLCLECK